MARAAFLLPRAPVGEESRVIRAQLEPDSGACEQTVASRLLEVIGMILGPLLPSQLSLPRPRTSADA